MGATNVNFKYAEALRDWEVMVTKHIRSAKISRFFVLFSLVLSPAFFLYLAVMSSRDVMFIPLALLVVYLAVIGRTVNRYRCVALSLKRRESQSSDSRSGE